MINEGRGTGNDVWIYENPDGLLALPGSDGGAFTIKWSRIRAALKRKDRR